MRGLRNTRTSDLRRQIQAAEQRRPRLISPAPAATSTPPASAKPTDCAVPVCASWLPAEFPVDGNVVGRFDDEVDEVPAEVVVGVDEPPELPEPVDVPDPEPSWPQPADVDPLQVAPPPVSGATEGVGSAAKAGAVTRTGPPSTHTPTRPTTRRFLIASPNRS